MSSRFFNYIKRRVYTQIKALVYGSNMSKINFGFLEVDLNQFVGAVKNILSTDLDKESKDAITKMIEEIRGTYESTIVSLIPFYGITQSDDNAYVSEFTTQFMSFKKTYLLNRGNLGVHCQVIKDNLQQLLDRQNWIGKFPKLKESLHNLNYLANKWSTSRGALEESLEGFLSTANKTLSEIDDLNRMNLITQSRSKLYSFLKESEQSFNDIKEHLDELKVISAKLS